jgi:hypothetical protein
MIQDMTPSKTWTRRVLTLSAVVWLAGAGSAREAASQPGLLFYLSGDHGLTADVAAGGETAPNFASGVRVIPAGAKGPGLECSHTQLLSYWAPGNIYAQRGTLSFSWRSREPVGPTPFPIFRVGYGDHSSWDMAWLRIDYNGRGFDAFVTDASLARTRVSYAMPSFPAPDRWTHIAFTWDETRGIRLYVDGRLVARQDGAAIFDAALDQFGPHSRIISPYQVQSAYNFVRGGDIDEVRIYDRMLPDESVATLARGDAPPAMAPLARLLGEPQWRDEWWLRNGWNRGGDAPPALDAAATSIRKVEIHDAWDVKRWWWKGTDGIRETTWPGVYNRSRLPGRNDYFQLPDWDCYSISGKSVTFVMPDEPWNHLEIAGAAWGSARLGPSADNGTLLFERPKGQERTFHRLPSPVRGQAVTFTNVEQETPIGEFGAYYVAPGREPDGIGKLAYRLSASAEPTPPSVQEALAFVSGRHPADERAAIVAVPAGAAPAAPTPPARASASADLPIVHVLIPSDYRDADAGTRRARSTYSWENLPGGLDGIALDLPALNVTPTHGASYPLRIQVKDPIWPLRNMMDVSVSVKPGEARTIWLDLRDRILPNEKGLYLTLSGAGPGLTPAALDGAAVRLVFKARQDALAEHTQDRFTQVRDNYAHIVEESPRTRRLKLFARWEGDMTDLLRVDPDHVLGRQYWYDYNKEQPAPPVTLATPPAGAPLWAFRQTELLGAIKRFVFFYIDKRQIDNGEFGGGLSDDGDHTNAWPGTAFMGGDPAKIRRSLDRHMEAYYEQGMFTQGLSTIQADELHSYEEGIQVLGQSLLLDFGNPKQLERAMATAAALESITGVNKAGHRHIRTSYFSGTTMALEGVWGWQKPSGFLALHPAIALVDYNGAPRVRTWLLELADGLLAHYDPRTRTLRITLEFATDNDAPSADALGLQAPDRAWPLLWAAYRWTGDKKYIAPLLDIGPRVLSGISANALDYLGLRDSWRTQLSAPEWTANRSDSTRHVLWQTTGDLRYLESLYEDQVRAALLREYINTEGSLWIDRVQVPMNEIQRARLGGVAIVRNMVVPGHAVSWEFPSGDDEKVGILVPDATPRRLTVVGYNLGAAPIDARMSTWDVEPGSWEVTVGTRREPAAGPLTNAVTSTKELERSGSLPITFAPGVYTVVQLRQVAPGVPYWQRPDLGIAREDVRVVGQTLRVTVHSLGAVAAPASRVVVRGRDGSELAGAAAPSMPAPADLKPRSTTVVLRLPAGATLAGASVSVETAGAVKEVTRVNNSLSLQ